MIQSFQPQVPFFRSSYPVGEAGLKAYKADVEKFVKEQFDSYAISMRSQLEANLRMQEAHANNFITTTFDIVERWENQPPILYVPN